MPDVPLLKPREVDPKGPHRQGRIDDRRVPGGAGQV